MAIPEIEDEDELQEILASSGLVAIDFSAAWCAPCKATGVRTSGPTSSRCP